MGISKECPCLNQYNYGTWNSFLNVYLLKKVVLLSNHENHLQITQALFIFIISSKAQCDIGHCDSARNFCIFYQKNSCHKILYFFEIMDNIYFDHCWVNGKVWNRINFSTFVLVYLLKKKLLFLNCSQAQPRLTYRQFLTSAILLSWITPSMN